MPHSNLTPDLSLPHCRGGAESAKVPNVARSHAPAGGSEAAVTLGFGSGMRIATASGARAIETIAVGDLVVTADAGLQPVRGCGATRIAATGDDAPVVFAPGAIGNAGALVLSQQHRLQVTGWRPQLWFGEDAVLVPAKAFVDGQQITCRDGGFVTYHHILFDAHQVVFIEGVAIESYYPGEPVEAARDPQTRADIATMSWDGARALYGPPAARDVRGAEARVLLAA